MSHIACMSTRVTLPVVPRNAVMLQGPFGGVLPCVLRTVPVETTMVHAACCVSHVSCYLRCILCCLRCTLQVACCPLQRCMPQTAPHRWPRNVLFFFIADITSYTSILECP
jgi:hypothetical protein